mmetsp:Transcript_75862/g.123202  ORF Transcript_75862/g.123202 Transcript_75862/m.123202 type:complete len:144 (+) Transcript_75862:723-1154(+)
MTLVGDVPEGGGQGRLLWEDIKNCETKGINELGETTLPTTGPHIVHTPNLSNLAERACIFICLQCKLASCVSKLQCNALPPSIQHPLLHLPIPYIAHAFIQTTCSDMLSNMNVKILFPAYNIRLVDGLKDFVQALDCRLKTLN